MKLKITDFRWAAWIAAQIGVLYVVVGPHWFLSPIALFALLSVYACYKDRTATAYIDYNFEEVRQIGAWLLTLALIIAAFESGVIL